MFVINLEMIFRNCVSRIIPFPLEWFIISRDLSSKNIAFSKFSRPSVGKIGKRKLYNLI